MTGGSLSATTRIEVEVRVLDVKLFEFRHNRTGVWADGRLQKFDSETLDDSKFFVVGRATAGGDGAAPTSWWAAAGRRRSPARRC